MNDRSYFAIHNDKYISFPSHSTNVMKLYSDAEFYLVKEIIDAQQVFRIVDVNGVPSTYPLSCGTLYGFTLNTSTEKIYLTLEIKDRVTNTFVRHSQSLKLENRDNVDVKTIIESVFATIEQYASTQIVPRNEIWYKTSNGRVVQFYSCYDEEIDFIDNFGANLISNTYVSGRGTLLFDGDVTKVGEALNHSNLTTIYLPDSVVEIEDSAFNGCAELEQFVSELASNDGRCLIVNNEIKAFAPSGLCKYTIPQGVNKMNDCFSECKQLIEIDIPEGVIDLSVDGCCNLSRIHIPNSVQSLDFCAFGQCHSLDSVEIPYGITKIGIYCFENCHNLTRVIVPESVSRIDDGAFIQCSRLDDIVLPSSINYVGSQAFNECISLSAIELPTSLQNVGTGAFENCSSLEHIVFPLALKVLNARMFKGCESLKRVDIPDTIEVIREECFKGCKHLKQVTIGCSVSSIENGVFQGCSQLSQLYCRAVTPPNMDSKVFGKGRPKCRIYVPMQSLELYKHSKAWKQYSDYIEGYEFE